MAAISVWHRRIDLSRQPAQNRGLLDRGHLQMLLPARRYSPGHLEAGLCARILRAFNPAEDALRHASNVISEEKKKKQSVALGQLGWSPRRIEKAMGVRREAQTYLDSWEERRADKRIHRTTKRQVAAMFAEEKPTLQQLLPIEPFHYCQ